MLWGNFGISNKENFKMDKFCHIYKNKKSERHVCNYFKIAISAICQFNMGRCTCSSGPLSFPSVVGRSLEVATCHVGRFGYFEITRSFSG